MNVKLFSTQKDDLWTVNFELLIFFPIFAGKKVTGFRTLSYEIYISNIFEHCLDIQTKFELLFSMEIFGVYTDNFQKRKLYFRTVRKLYNHQFYDAFRIT